MTCQESIDYEKLGISAEAFDGQFLNRSVALVGNAKSLLTTCHGKAIDDHDIVVRCNIGFDHLVPVSTGSKTDVCFVGCAKKRTIKLDQYRRAGVKSVCWVDWEKHYHSFIPPHLRDGTIPTYFYKEADEAQHYWKTPLKLSTGFIAFLLLVETQFQSLNVYGFDGFKTPSIHNQYALTHHWSPHNGEKELDWMRNYVIAYEASHKIKLNF